MLKNSAIIGKTKCQNRTRKFMENDILKHSKGQQNYEKKKLNIAKALHMLVYDVM